MDTISRAIGFAGTALLLATLGGVIRRGRLTSWYSFAAYLAAMAGLTLVFLIWPLLYNEDGWAVHLTVTNVLRYAMALELAGRTFRPFPGARSTLRPLLLVVLVVTLVLVADVSRPDLDYQTFLTEQQARLLNGNVWLYTAIAGLILWYRLPVLRFQKSVLLTYLPYLFLEAVYLNVFVEAGWQNRFVGYAHQAAYLLLVCCWAWFMWRSDAPRPSGSASPPGPAPPAPPSQLERIAYSVGGSDGVA